MFVALVLLILFENYIVLPPIVKKLFETQQELDWTRGGLNGTPAKEFIALQQSNKVHMLYIHPIRVLQPEFHKNWLRKIKKKKSMIQQNI